MSQVLAIAQSFADARSFADTKTGILTESLTNPFSDHREARAQNRLHPERAPEPAPTARVIEIGEVTAGIVVPEPGGVRFFSSSRDFDPLDGAIFRSVEQAAKAARERFRQRTRPAPRRGLSAPRLVAV
jgi:hypothetical protein